MFFIKLVLILCSNVLCRFQRCHIELPKPYLVLVIPKHLICGLLAAYCFIWRQKNICWEMIKYSLWWIFSGAIQYIFVIFVWIDLFSLSTVDFIFVLMCRYFGKPDPDIIQMSDTNRKVVKMVVEIEFSWMLKFSMICWVSYFFFLYSFQVDLHTLWIHTLL